MQKVIKSLRNQGFSKRIYELKIMVDSIKDIKSHNLKQIIRCVKALILNEHIIYIINRSI